MALLTTVSPPTAVEAPRIAAFGEWDTANLGDKAIFEGVLDFVQGAGWCVDAYSLGSLIPISGHLQGSGQPTLTVGGWSPKPFQTATLQTSHRRVQGWRAGAYVCLKQWLRPARQHVRIRRLLPQLRRAQGILVGGGALLSDEHLHFPQSLAAVGWAAKKLCLPILCLGCSADGEWSPRGERTIAQFVRSCSVIAVRDAATARRVTTIWGRPVPIFGDFALSPGRCRKAGVQPPQALKLAVNVMRVPRRSRADQERYEDVLVETAATWMQRHGFAAAPQIHIFTTGTPEDIAPASSAVRLAQLSAIVHSRASLQAACSHSCDD